MVAMSDATPEWTPMPAPPSDEISLRELYLVLRRNALWILGVAIVTGAVAYFFVASRPEQFESHAVVVYEAPPVAVRGGDAFAASLVTAFPYEAYEALAFDRVRVAAVLERAAGVDWSIDQFLGRARLARRSTANSATLTVEHAVRAPSAEQAAQAAQTWADLTAAAVRETIRFRVVESGAVADRASELRADLEAAEDALSVFASTDASTELRAREAYLVQRLQELDRRGVDAMVTLESLRVERGVRLADVEVLRGERSTLTGTDERAYAGERSDDVLTRAGERAREARDAWRIAADRLATFDAATPLELWQVELVAVQERITEALTTEGMLMEALSQERAHVRAATEALARLPTVVTLRTALIEDGGLAAALGGEAPLTGTPVVTETQNPVRIETEQALEIAIRQVAGLEAALVDLSRRLPELRAREAELRAGLAEGSVAREDLEREARTAALLATELAATEGALTASTSDDVRLAPSGPLAQAEDALRTLERRVAALEAEMGAVDDAARAAGAELVALRITLATLDRERARLQRDHDLAASLYRDVAALAPSLEVIEVLAPLGVRILSAAYVPARGEASRPMLIGILAAVVVAFGMIVLVLLREAIAERPGGGSAVRLEEA
jgi:hypothetical protein